MTSNRFKIMEDQTRILQDVAAAWPQESPQYAAIKNAAFALIFAISEEYESFTRFVESCSNELSNEQKDNLKKLGITVS